MRGPRYLILMKDQAKSLLTERLSQLHCERVPAWLQARLLATVEAEAASIDAKAQQQLHRRISRVITVHTVAAAFLAGPPASNGEGSKGEGANASLLSPTGFEAQPRGVPQNT